MTPRLRRPDPESPATLQADALRQAWRGPAPSSTERALFVGKPGSGKSQVGAVIFAMVKSRRLAFDFKGGSIDIADDGSGVCHAHGWSDIDWSCRTIVYHPRKVSDASELARVYAAAYDIGSFTIWLDESVGPTDSSRTNEEVTGYLTRGRSRHCRHLAMTQRPVHIDPFLRATADHVAIFGRGATDTDIKMLAGDLGMKAERLRRALVEIRRMGDYAWLHYHVKANHIARRPPLPLWMIETCPVQVK